MKYRPHKGSLDEAMSLAVDVDGLDGLISQLCKELAPYPVWPDKTSVHVSPYFGDDDRIGWRDVHIVTLDGYGVMGFCEGPADG